MTIEKSKVFLWNDGKWFLEGAATLADLNTRTGSWMQLVNNRSYAFFKWDSLTFGKQTLRYLRLRLKNPTGPGVYLGEWTIEGTVTYTNFVIYPAPLMLVPGASARLTIKIRDDRGKVSPNFLTEPLNYQTANPAVAVGNADGYRVGCCARQHHAHGPYRRQRADGERPCHGGPGLSCRRRLPR